MTLALMTPLFVSALCEHTDEKLHKHYEEQCIEKYSICMQSEESAPLVSDARALLCIQMLNHCEQIKCVLKPWGVIKQGNKGKMLI